MYKEVFITRLLKTSALSRIEERVFTRIQNCIESDKSYVAKVLIIIVLNQTIFLKWESLSATSIIIYQQISWTYDGVIIEDKLLGGQGDP